ncbi:MAG: hypothetical protein H6557_01345 [Lewinellaceae bacterium]|nr:hypothetical protein [Phaeodactylibacter sp.]MCB9035247.1 hypothetical protein [Lewinellaceae bacterium]
MANNPMLSRFLALGFCLAAPVLGLLIFSSPLPEPSGKHGVSGVYAVDSLDLQCRPGQAVELFPVDTDGDDIPDEGRWPLWADDMVDTARVQCGEELVFSINREGETPDSAAAVLFLGCEDAMGTGFVNIEVHAWCEGEIAASCLTYVGVFDNFLICGHELDSFSVEGRIIREDGLPIEGVEVSLSGPRPGFALTDAQGHYHFSDPNVGDDITITPEKNFDYTEGVSTQDLVLISRHILGVDRLGSPYQLIAADVNNSRHVTTLDLIMLRRLLLGIDIEFETNTSWRFVELDYTFPDPSNPWHERFPEWINVNDLPFVGAADLDFVAVKIGDVSLD